MAGHQPAGIPDRSSPSRALTSQLTDLISVLPVPMLLVDKQGRLLQMNQLAGTLLRMSAKDRSDIVVGRLPQSNGAFSDAVLLRVVRGTSDNSDRGSNVRFSGTVHAVGGLRCILVEQVDATGFLSSPTLREFLHEEGEATGPLHVFRESAVAVPVRPGIPPGLAVRISAQEELGLLVRYYRGAPAFLAAGPMLELIRTGCDAAAQNYPLLIQGERGCGKRLFARLIHFWSHRSTQPLIVLTPEQPYWDDAVSTETEEGLVMHPVLQRLKQASRGTVVLHHAHRLPDRWLEFFRQVAEEGLTDTGDYPLGGLRCRIVATVVSSEVTERRVWQDFTDVVGVRRLALPGLEKCKEIVGPAVSYFAFRFAYQFRTPLRSVDPEVFDWLERNCPVSTMRALRGLVYRACAACQGTRLTPEHFLDDEGPARSGTTGASEPERILRVLRMCGGKRGHAARMLGVSRSTLYRRIRQLREQGQWPTDGNEAG